jgi:hypothetical protein
MGDGSHLAHIQSGISAELGDVVPLSDLATPKVEHTGAARAIEAKLGLNLIDMPLEEFLDSAYLIDVHMSAEEIDASIARSDIGGVIMPGDEDEDVIHAVSIPVPAIRQHGVSGHCRVPNVGIR